jgi:transposase-like protein
MRKITNYSTEEKQLVLKEAIESDNIPTVSKKFNIPEGTIYDWVRKAKNSPTKVINSKDQEIKKLKKQLEDEKLKNEIMRELLKKSYQVLG